MKYSFVQIQSTLQTRRIIRSIISIFGCNFIDSAIPGPDNSGKNGSSPLTASPAYPGAPEPLDDVHDFIMGDDRYMDLQMVAPSRADVLRPRLQEDCNLENSALRHLSDSTSCPKK